MIWPVNDSRKASEIAARCCLTVGRGFLLRVPRHNIRGEEFNEAPARPAPASAIAAGKPSIPALAYRLFKPRQMTFI